MITSLFSCGNIRNPRNETDDGHSINIAVPNDDIDSQYNHVNDAWLSPSTKGLAMSTVFAAAYFIRPIHMALPVLSILYGNVPIRLGAYVAVAIIVTSFFVKPKPMPNLVLKLWSPILDYFQFDEIIENSPIHIQESISDGKQYIFACQPHGIVPFCSVGWGVRQAALYGNNKKSSKTIPTAVASLVLFMPILKHVMGMFGCVTATTMRQQLKDKEVMCVRLYVGSTTEIFYSNKDTETLHLSKRKNFIKVALMMGVDVIPGTVRCYSCFNTVCSVFNARVWYVVHGLIICLLICFRFVSHLHT